MKILLIGSNGYLGSALNAYFRVNGADILEWGSKENLFHLTSKEVAGVAGVVNCAVGAFTSQSSTEVNLNDEKINVQGPEHLAKILQPTHVPLIQISSKEVYGPVYQLADVVEEKSRYIPKHWVEESQTLNPQTSYARTKLMGEAKAKEHIRTNIIRLSSGYTDFDHARGNWMVNLYKSTLAKKPISVSGNGKQLRDPLHAHDLGNLILKMLTANKWGFTVNAGGGMGNSISILEYIAQVAPEARPRSFGTGDYGYVTSNRLAQEIWDWSPRILLADRFPTLLENIRNGKKAGVR